MVRLSPTRWPQGQPPQMDRRRSVCAFRAALGLYDRSVVTSSLSSLNLRGYGSAARRGPNERSLEQRRFKGEEDLARSGARVRLGLIYGAIEGRQETPVPQKGEELGNIEAQHHVRIAATSAAK